MATQNLNLALQPIILDIDDTTSQIATLLAAQTNDQERYALVEKIIIELLNKNKELLCINKTLQTSNTLCEARQPSIP